MLFPYDGLISSTYTPSGSAGALGLDLSAYSRIVLTVAGVTGPGATARVKLWSSSGSATGSTVPIREGGNSLSLAGFTAAQLGDIREFDLEIDGISATTSVRVLDISAAKGMLRHVSSTDATCGGSSPCYATIQAALTAAQPGGSALIDTPATGFASCLANAGAVEPPRVYRRLHSLRGWSHEQAAEPVFTRSS